MSSTGINSAPSAKFTSEAYLKALEDDIANGHLDQARLMRLGDEVMKLKEMISRHTHQVVCVGALNSDFRLVKQNETPLLSTFNRTLGGKAVPVHLVS